MSKTTWLSFGLTVALLLSAIVVGGMTERRVADSLSVPLDQIDSHISGWTQISQHKLDSATLRALDPTSYLARTYQRDTSQIELFIAYYAQQRAGESMHSPQHCLPGSGWEILRRDSAVIPVAGKQVTINRFVIENLGTKMLMLYWYQSRNRIVANEYMAKILLARDTALTGHTSGSMVRLLLSNDNAAENEALQFAASLIPRVQRCLGHD